MSLFDHGDCKIALQGRDESREGSKRGVQRADGVFTAFSSWRESCNSPRVELVKLADAVLALAIPKPLELSPLEAGPSPIIVECRAVRSDMKS